MFGDFNGTWKCNDEEIKISSIDKTFRCSFANENIGIIFRDSLVVAEFNDTAQNGGIGVYSPVGDGSSYFSLWSSTNIIGRLGSGILLKSDGLEQIVGEYSVRYFIGKQETQSFTVKIEPTRNSEIYNLSWFQNEQKVLHGIGTILGDSLAFAWGSIDNKYNFHVFNFYENNILKMQTAKWNTKQIDSVTFTKSI